MTGNKKARRSGPFAEMGGWSVPGIAERCRGGLRRGDGVDASPRGGVTAEAEERASVGAKGRVGGAICALGKRRVAVGASDGVVLIGHSMSIRPRYRGCQG
jgi:hypothetical protein